MPMIRTPMAILPALTGAVGVTADAITYPFITKTSRGSRACKRPALPTGRGSSGSGNPIR